MFRTTKYLLPDVDVKSVPLLSVHNVHPFKTVWPTKRNGKPLAFRLCDGSLKYLVPSRNYVLLRRFSSKEERRRLTASCLFAGFEGATHVALENHINYVYHESRELSVDEMFGVAALFNSTLLDRYFRAISGNTQVNATEVRVMRFLDLATIARIGKQARMASDPSQQIIDDAVCAELDVSGEAVSAYRSNIS
jgi:adenine-specific DNA-methyltransferase